MSTPEGIQSIYYSVRQTDYHMLTRGDYDAEPIVFVHGNTASAVFWEDVMLALPDDYRSIAPDLRCFGLTEPTPIDATRGVREWSDDLYEITWSLGMREFHLVGWSLGGGIAMQYVLDHPNTVTTLTLVAPVSPYGFSGTRGPDGIPCWPDYAGSGAGGVNKEFLKLMKEKVTDAGENPALPRNILNACFWKPGFQAEREDEFLDAMLQTAIGEDAYPGDSEPSPNWPGYAPGNRGVLNAFSPKHFRADSIVDLDVKPPILWVRGADDQLISDASPWDIGYLGKLGFVPGWPGDSTFPPQPMISQTRAVLDRYVKNGGFYREVVFHECGHSPHVEKRNAFVQELIEHIRWATTYM
jgi:pimeloyl-ACP methyl ester carboxylesterase